MLAMRIQGGYLAPWLSIILAKIITIIGMVWFRPCLKSTHPCPHIVFKGMLRLYSLLPYSRLLLANAHPVELFLTNKT